MEDETLKNAAATLADVAKIKEAGDRLLESEVTDHNLTLENSKLRIKERRNGRMQIRFNLSKDEALGFKNFMSMVRPDGITDEVFMKSCFLQGCRSMQEELASLVQKYAEANPEELEDLGVEVVTDEDGGVTINPTEEPEV